MYTAIKSLQDPEEQHSTEYDAENTPANNNAECNPVVDKTTDSSTNTQQAATNSNTENAPVVVNNIEHTPAVAPRAWHHTAMSAATFTLSAILGYIATEAIFKRIRGRN